MLRAAGLRADRGVRGAQRTHLAEQDVDCPDLPAFWFEVKNTEKLSLYAAMAQAEADAELAERIPVVAHKRNRKPWLVVMRAEDWLRLVRDKEEG